MIEVYTLNNCDTCKKALKWLEAEDIDYVNIDVRSDGLDRFTVETIVDTAGWETAINRRGTTWRRLDDSQKADMNNEKAVELILEMPTLMKRPVFVWGVAVIIGFDEQTQETVKLFA